MKVLPFCWMTPAEEPVVVAMPKVPEVLKLPGSRPADRVPLDILLAFVVSVVAEAARPETFAADGWANCGSPEVEIPVMNWFVPAAPDCTPPRALAAGEGSRAAGSVPLVMLDAFVVSVVAEAARPEIFIAEGWA